MSGSGDLGTTLRDPVTYPNWMWVVGAVLAVLAVAWAAVLLWRWWRSEDTQAPELLTISEAERRRYRGLLDQIRLRQADGELDLRGVHLAVAGLMRALGTQRSGRDLEVATVEEIDRLVPSWPELVDVLRECEQPSFSGESGGPQAIDEAVPGAALVDEGADRSDDARVARTLDLARRAVGA